MRLSPLPPSISIPLLTAPYGGGLSDLDPASVRPFGPFAGNQQPICPSLIFFPEAALSVFFDAPARFVSMPQSLIS